MTRQIHISNFFGTRNKGDEAMLRGLIAVLSDGNPDIGISVSAFYPNPEGEKNLPVATFVPSLGCTGGLRDRAAVALLSFLLLVKAGKIFEWALPRLKPRGGAAVEAIRQADAVYLTGGPFFAETYTSIAGMRVPTFNLLVPSIEPLVARLYGKKLFVVGQSFGLLTSWVSRFLMKQLFAYASLVTTRESVSLAYIEERFHPGSAAFRHPDLAFANRAEVVAAKSATSLVAVNVRRMSREDLCFLFRENRGNVSAAALYDRYLGTIADTVRLIGASEPATRYLFLNQGSENDKFAAEDVAKRAGLDGAKFDIQPEGTAFETLLEAVATADFVISTRYHATMFSIMTGTAFAAIGYGRKIEAALVDYGLLKNVFRGPAFNADALYAAYLARDQYVPHDVALRLREELFEALRPIKISPTA